MEDISAQFECYPIFDSYNKLVNLYDESELGENLELLLSYDNYLKSNEKTTDTEEIVTRLTLIGNEDLTIVNCNPTGLRYIEDFSYYIENKEMSDELILAFERYEIVKNRIAKEIYDLEDKLAVLLTLLSSQIVNNMINNEFDKKYVIYIPETIYSKSNKLDDIFDMFEDEFAKNSVVVLLQYSKMGENKEIIKKLIKQGYHFGIDIKVGDNE